VTGRFREAKSILRSYARALDRGLLPNRFPDTMSRAEFDSVDATLWFFVAIFKYLQYTGDFEFVKTELRIPLLEIMRYLEEGTRFGIRVDDRDGLLSCGEPGLALTWMDARVDEKSLTPRNGKPVEVNALWYNALKLMERLAERFSIPNDMARFARRAEQVEDNFLSTFWNDRRGCLYDVVQGNDKDPAVRPNQILALSLPFPLLDSESAETMVNLVGQRLLVPMGLRSLEPGHVDYQGEYDGSRSDRGRARHQGSAWTWLLGAYVTALVKAKGAEARVEAGRLLQAAEKHLSQDGLGQVSEISWGDAPHWPRGAPAHATAVAELLRAYYEDILGKNPALRPDDVWRKRRR
jgi:predicted glycogen debranching enzyme